MKRFMSALRYPGSKVRIAEMIARLLERNLLVGSHIYEPFAGGSAVSMQTFWPIILYAPRHGSSATPMVYAFWKMVKAKPETLVDRMMKDNVTLASWKRMQPLRGIDKPT